MQVISHTLRQHLTTRQTQPPTTHTIPKLALDYRNHRLHLPTLTIQPARFDTLHDPRTQHARPRPQPTPAPYRRYHIRPLYIPPIKPCVRQQPKSCRTPLAYYIPTRLGTQRGYFGYNSRMPNTVERLRIENFGPIVEAEVEFGDLTVFVGPQATGKSLFLQIFKLLQDRGFIWERFKSTGLVWTSQPREFLELYLGEGMGGAYPLKIRALSGTAKPLNLPSI